MSSIFIIAYDTPRPTIGPVLGNYYWHRGPDGVAQTPEVAVNPHFIGRFTQTSYQRAINSPNTDTVVITPQAETQPHFIGKFTATTLGRALQSWSTDGAPFVLDTVNANPHFIGRFNQPIYQRVKYAPANDFPIVSDLIGANNHFIGKFTPMRYTYLRKYIQNDPQDFSTIIAQILSSGRYITEEEVYEATLAHRKWNERLQEATKLKTVHPDISQIASKLGAKGGHARAQAMTPNQRSNQASKAAQVRWSK